MTRGADFDVEAMLRLASGNPREFVRCREELIKWQIDKSSQQAVLGNLQMQLDVLRYSSVGSGHTLDRLRVMICENTELLQGHVMKLNNLLNDG